MAYELITDRKTPNFGYPTGTARGNSPEEIVLHHWGGDNSTLEGTVDWLCNPVSEVSAHDVATAEKVIHLLDYSIPAWHAGNRWHNEHSIGIECNPRCSDGDMQTVAELIADIWRQYGKLPIVGHKDIVSTACPGRWYNNINKIYKMAEAIYDSGINTNSGSKNKITEDGYWGKDTTLATQRKLKLPYHDGVLSNQFSGNLDACLNSDYINRNGWDFVDYVSTTGSDTVRAIQSKVGAGVDGVFGPATVRAMQRFLGVEVDGLLGPDTIKAWQKWLNN